MITCRECEERMYPESPKVKSGRYHLCGCNYCGKPTYYRELEERVSPIKEPVVHHTHSYTKPYGELSRRLEQVEGRTLYLDRKVKERTDKHKRISKYK